jgi:ABC-type transport system involved in cytochrome c biogenesis permease subunit
MSAFYFTHFRAPRKLKVRLTRYESIQLMEYRARWAIFALLVVGVLLGSVWQTPEMYKLRYMLRTGNSGVKIINRNPFR